MNIHEYQAKALLRSYGAPVSDGRIVLRAEEAKTAAGALDGPLWVVKAQIHAGGRGKAGGVKLAKTLDEVRAYAKGMLGTNGVVGASIPLAVGAGLTSKIKNLGRVAVAFFGDGAAATGAGARCASIFLKDALAASQNNFTMPVGPLRCFAI